MGPPNLLALDVLIVNVSVPTDASLLKASVPDVDLQEVS
jgi:hypothetical protein